MLFSPCGRRCLSAFPDKQPPCSHIFARFPICYHLRGDDRHKGLILSNNGAGRTARGVRMTGA